MCFGTLGPHAVVFGSKTKLEPDASKRVCVFFIDGVCGTTMQHAHTHKRHTRTSKQRETTICRHCSTRTNSKRKMEEKHKGGKWIIWEWVENVKMVEGVRCLLHHTHTLKQNIISRIHSECVIFHHLVILYIFPLSFSFSFFLFPFPFHSHTHTHTHTLSLSFITRTHTLTHSHFSIDKYLIDPSVVQSPPVYFNSLIHSTPQAHSTLPRQQHSFHSTTVRFVWTQRHTHTKRTHRTQHTPSTHRIRTLSPLPVFSQCCSCLSRLGAPICVGPLLFCTHITYPTPEPKPTLFVSPTKRTRQISSWTRPCVFCHTHAHAHTHSLSLSLHLKEPFRNSLCTDPSLLCQPLGLALIIHLYDIYHIYHIYQYTMSGKSKVSKDQQGKSHVSVWLDYFRCYFFKGWILFSAFAFFVCSMEDMEY